MGGERMTLAEGTGRSYQCPRCARALVVYVNPAGTPRCTRCNRVMVETEAESMSGQLSLFSVAPERVAKRGDGR